jgi:hypothetical protein
VEGAGDAAVAAAAVVRVGVHDDIYVLVAFRILGLYIILLLVAGGGRGGMSRPRRARRLPSSFGGRRPPREQNGYFWKKKKDPINYWFSSASAINIKILPLLRVFQFANYCNYCNYCNYSRIHCDKIPQPRCIT